MKHRTWGRSIKETKPIVRRFIIGFFIIALTLLGTGVLRYTLSVRGIATSEALSKTNEILHMTHNLNKAYQDIRLASQRYAMTGDAAVLEEMQQFMGEFDDTFTMLGELTSDNPAQQDRLSMVDQTYHHFLDNIIYPALQITQDQGGNTKEILANPSFIEVSKKGTNISATLTYLLQQVHDAENDLLLARQRDMNRWFKLGASLAFLSPLLILVVVFLTLWRGISKLEEYRKQIEHNQDELQKAKNKYANAIEGGNLGTWEWEVKTGLFSANERWAKFIGRTLDELGPVTEEVWGNFIHPEDMKIVCQKIQEVIENKQGSFSCEFRMMHKDGHWVWLQSYGKVIASDETGSPLLMAGTQFDVTKRMEALYALHEREEESRKLFDAMNQGFAYCEIITDGQNKPIDFRILRVNKNFEARTGLNNKNSVGKTARELLPNLEPIWMENNGKVALSGESMVFEAYTSDLDRYFRISSFSPAHGMFAMIIEDITKQREIEQQLHYEKELFETTLLSVGDGVISTDNLGIIKFMNSQAEFLSGWDADEAKGKPFAEVFKTLEGKHRTEGSDPIAEVLTHHRPFNLSDDTILVSRDGQERYIDDSTAPILDTKGEVTGAVLVFRDSTEKSKKQHEMLNLSFKDSLTNLHNRRYYDQVKRTMDEQPYYPLALVLADVNGLKLTNDAFGHEAGDQLLKQVSKVFTATCREHDIVTRIGGDEFVLLLPQTDALHAKAIVRRLNAALQKQEIKGIQVSVSFGYAVKDEESSESLDDTFKEAEDVMYRNKLSTSIAFKKQVISSLLDRLFDRDPRHRLHSEKVSVLAEQLARALGYSDLAIEEVRQAAALHDLGKIALSDAVLNKPYATLRRSELMEYHRHAEIGYNILRSVDEYTAFADAILHHHENWDGTGYPENMKGDDIPALSRLIATADCFVNKTEGERNAEGMTQEEALQYLKEESGYLLDPNMVEAFLGMGSSQA